MNINIIPTVIFFFLIELDSKTAHQIPGEVYRLADRVYFLNSETCCDGKIYKNSSYRFSCCAGKLYNREIQMCCFPNIYRKHLEMACCGERSFNMTTHTCKPFVIKNRTDLYSDFDPTKTTIMPKYQQTDTCNGHEISDSDICCNYKTITDPRNELDCCGNGTINKETQICCYNRDNNNKIISKYNPSDNECCNGKPYNADTHSCIYNSIVPADIYLNPNSSALKCNGIDYNQKTQLCCYSGNDEVFAYKTVDKIYPNDWRCCGNLTYSFELCCSVWTPSGIISRLYQRDFSDSRCCGIVLMNSSMACCGSETPYDPLTETCCEVRVNRNTLLFKVHHRANRKCCNLEAYDETSDFCCGTTVIPKTPPGQSACCPYNADTNV